MRCLSFLMGLMIFNPVLIEAAQSQQVPEKAKIAASPLEAVKYLIEAAKADDVDGFGAQLAEHSRALFEMGKAAEGFETALNDKFGKNAARPGNPLSVKSEMAPFKLKTYEIREVITKEKDLALLTVWIITRRPKIPDIIHEETWISQKKETGWKIVFPEKGVVTKAVRKTSDGNEIKVWVLRSRNVEPKQSAFNQEMIASVSRLLGELTKEVRSGKYKSREEAEAALNTAKARLQKQ
jgi:hypothetical protein